MFVNMVYTIYKLLLIVIILWNRQKIVKSIKTDFYHFTQPQIINTTYLRRYIFTIECDAISEHPLDELE